MALPPAQSATYTTIINLRAPQGVTVHKIEPKRMGIIEIETYKNMLGFRWKPEKQFDNSIPFPSFTQNFTDENKNGVTIAGHDHLSSSI